MFLPIDVFRELASFNVCISLIKKTKAIRVCPVEDFPHLPLETQIYAQNWPSFTEKPPSSSHLGGKCMNWNFYPQSESYPTYFDADISSEYDKILLVRVN